MASNMSYLKRILFVITCQQVLVGAQHSVLLGKFSVEVEDNNATEGPYNTTVVAGNGPPKEAVEISGFSEGIGTELNYHISTEGFGTEENDVTTGFTFAPVSPSGSKKTEARTGLTASRVIATTGGPVQVVADDFNETTIEAVVGSDEVITEVPTESIAADVITLIPPGVVPEIGNETEDGQDEYHESTTVESPAEDNRTENSNSSTGSLLNLFYRPTSSSEGIENNEMEVINGTQVGSVSPEPTHPCSRECVEGELPMTCKYRFELEWYSSLSKACYNCPYNVTDCYRPHCVMTDGVKRPIVVVNRQLPGPSVRVCYGDKIVVDVVNHMMEESTSIHWHGHHQRGTPYMDGVPYVTQCPIPPKSSFRYRYRADTVGTHFWHSHSGCQRADGAFGALLVRVPRTKDPHSLLYDHDLPEHTIQILDWGHELGVVKFLTHHHADGDNKPRNILVNGQGRFQQFRAGSNVTYTPAAAFHVQQGHRYRFRLINAGFLNAPIQLSIDNHTLLVISSDGADIRPIEADSLVSYAGERFDFIINTTRPVANYWIRLRGLMDGDDRFFSTQQIAVLRYSGAPTAQDPLPLVSYNSSRRSGLTVNALNVGTGEMDSVVAPELDAMVEDDVSLKPEPDIRFYLSYDFYDLDNPHYHRAPLYGFHQVNRKQEKLYTPQLNHISMRLPSFPLLSQRELITPDMFCNRSTAGNCTEHYCECTHVLQVPLGAVMELILIDKGVTFDANHPFHLHGHAFRVLAMGRLGRSTTVEEVQALDAAGGIHRKLKKAPVKDTVTVPDGGYTVVRVHATNPGYWLFHCHIEFHVEVGMALVFKVGDHANFPRVPRGFPQCNSWLPSEDDMDLDLTTPKSVSPIIAITHWWPILTHSSSTASWSSGPMLGLLLTSLLVYNNNR